MSWGVRPIREASVMTTIRTNTAVMVSRASAKARTTSPIT